MRGEIALDSSVAVDLLAGDIKCLEQVNKYNTLYMPVPVVGELIYGALISLQVEKNLAGVNKLISRSKLIPCDYKTAERYARVKAELKETGKPIPETDLWISACCLEQNVALATRDRHFDHIKSLEKENW